MKYTKAMIEVVELQTEDVVLTSTTCSVDCWDDTGFECRAEL